MKKGDEVVIIGPNVWGQWIRTGCNATVTREKVFGGMELKYHSDGRCGTFPDESLMPRADFDKIFHAGKQRA